MVFFNDFSNLLQGLRYCLGYQNWLNLTCLKGSGWDMSPRKWFSHPYSMLEINGLCPKHKDGRILGFENGIRNRIRDSFESRISNVGVLISNPESRISNVGKLISNPESRISNAGKSISNPESRISNVYLPLSANLSGPPEWFLDPTPYLNFSGVSPPTPPNFFQTPLFWWSYHSYSTQIPPPPFMTALKFGSWKSFVVFLLRKGDLMYTPLKDPDFSIQGGGVPESNRYDEFTDSGKI